MKRTVGSKRDCLLAEVCIFLITAALITATTGCASVRYTLSITSTTGGAVVEPGEGSFTYADGTVVDLVVEAEEGYGLTWTGDVYSIASIHSFSTNITMYDNYSITATLAEIQGIQDWYDLDAIRDDLSGHYTLMNDLDSTTAGYDELASPTANGGKGWEPIGFFDPQIGSARPVFSGTFDGQGYEIEDLFINRPEYEESPVGLFGSIDKGAHIENIGVVNVDVTGFQTVGGLVGLSGRDFYNTTVNNCYAEGNISGRAAVGGLVGASFGNLSDSYSNTNVTGRVQVGSLVGTNGDGCTVSGSRSAGSVTGAMEVGGLVGRNCGTVSNSDSTASVSGNSSIGGLVGGNDHEGTVSSCYATGSINGKGGVGGLVGGNGGTVSASYSTGNVTGDENVGGLIGSGGGVVSNSCSTGIVAGNKYVGGLIGVGGVVSNSYCTGNVTGDEYVGGLVGFNWDTVSNSYSTGSVSGNSSVGGLVGEHGTASNCFWDTQTSGQATSAGGLGKTTVEMRNVDTFSDAGWNIIAVASFGMYDPSYVWNIVNGGTYPFLSWEA